MVVKERKEEQCPWVISHYMTDNTKSAVTIGVRCSLPVGHTESHRAEENGISLVWETHRAI